MYYSLLWIVRHLQSKVKINVPFVQQVKNILLTHIAEVDDIIPVILEKENFIFAEVIDTNKDSILLKDSKTDVLFSLNHRAHVSITDNYLVVKEGTKKRWATMKDLGGFREIIVPKISSEDNEYTISSEDYIISIDNKSIGNRSDLWCHRGIARELAYFLDIPLKQESDIYAHSQSIEARISNTKKQAPFILHKEDENISYACASYIPISEQSSRLSYMIDLCKIDVKPHSLLIDLSNYVMNDIGHPMHVFDKNLIKKSLSFSKAIDGSTLTLIDDTSITLSSNDMVICDNKKPISLGGIMGGKETSITYNSSEIIIEAATYDPDNIRKTSIHFNKHTLSSKICEKKLSCQGAHNALKRFISCLIDCHLITEFPVIIYDGQLDKKTIITIYHNSIEKIIGSTLSEKSLIKILEGLTFSVSLLEDSLGILYRIEVPYYRKDIVIAEDIIREIVRSLGFNSLTLTPPLLPAAYRNLSLKNNFTIKLLISSILNADEVVTYSIFNEETNKAFQSMNINSLSLRKGYSDFQSTMITTLIPNLIHIGSKRYNIKKQSINLFECGTVFIKNNEHNISEKEMIAIIMINNESSQYKFMENKHIINKFLRTLRKEHEIEWRKSTECMEYFSELSCDLYYKSHKVGRAGYINNDIIKNIYGKQASCFCFEIEEKVLLSDSMYHIDIYRDYEYCDISFLVEKTISLETIIEEIKNLSSEIIHIAIKDIFSKKEWNNNHSITIRIYYSNSTNHIIEKTVHIYMNKKGITIRS
jgi:phenylalanyl-tRNA synthetase beta chain